MNFFDYCIHGNIREVRRFLDWGYDVNQVDKDGETGLYKACRHGRYEVVIELLERGANVDHGKLVDEVFCEKLTPIWMTCLFYHRKYESERSLIFEELVRRGADAKNITSDFLGYLVGIDDLDKEWMLKFIEENGNKSNVKPAMRN